MAADDIQGTRMSDDITRSIRGSYDQIADEYARRIFNELSNKPLDQELLNRFIAEVSGRGDVCDMGCGPGHVARYLRDKGATVFGLDLSPGMLEQARQLNPDIQFREGNMMALDLKDESLAAITAFYAIVNLPKWSLPLVFRELERVLQPGGLLLLAFHTGNEVLPEDKLWGRSICMDFFLFQPSEIQQYLETARLVVEETIEREPYAPDVEYQSRRAYIFARKPVGHLTEKARGLGEKDLTVEAGEGRVDLKEQDARVTQHGRGGLCFVFFARHFDDMGRSIVLAFFPRIKFVAPGRDGRRLRDAMAPAESGESLIGEIRTQGAEFFMDPNQIPFALGVQLQDLLAVRLGFLRPQQRGYFGRVGTNDLAHAQARDSQHSRDLPFLHSLSMQF